MTKRANRAWLGAILLLLAVGFPFIVTARQEAGPERPAPNPHGDVTYLEGDLPVVLLAPHGGTRCPEGLPQRSDGPPGDFAADRLVLAIAEALAWTDADGREHRPHVVTMSLHRRIADANRSPTDPPFPVPAEDAIDPAPHPRAQRAYDDFHAFADFAVARVQEEHGLGLLLDVHGLAATRRVDHYGYLLRKADLHDPELPGASTDEHLARRIREASTLRGVAAKKETSAQVVDLVRGPGSLASLVDEAWKELYPQLVDAKGRPRGRPAKPSARYADPFSPPTPNHDGVYFNGRYDILAHGSRKDGVLVDAIQIETTRDARNTPEDRQRFARAMSIALQRFFARHHEVAIGPE